MAVPEKIDVDFSADNWDSAVEGNLDRLFNLPRPLWQWTGDETDLEAAHPAASNEQCHVYVNHSVLGRVIYKSDGTAWAPLVQAPTIALARWDGNDFCNAIVGSGTVPPFVITGLASGLTNDVAFPDGYGALRIQSIASANSGASIRTLNAASLYGIDGLSFAAILLFTGAALTASLQRIGFFDSANHNEATDGAFFVLASGVLAGRTCNNQSAGSNMTTSATWAPTINVAYLLTIRYENAGADVRFRVCELDGTERFNEVVTTNVPNTSARAFGAGLIATTTASQLQNHVHVDYMGFGPAMPAEFWL